MVDAFRLAEQMAEVWENLNLNGRQLHSRQLLITTARQCDQLQTALVKNYLANEGIFSRQTFDSLLAGTRQSLNVQLEPTPEEVQEQKKTLDSEAISVMACPDILEYMADTVQEFGQVGETANIKILYLAMISRNGEKPVSLKISGPSAGGKNQMINSVLKLIPRSAFCDFTSMSEKAIIYLSEPLSHRHIVVFESGGMGGGYQAYVIRSLLSEGRIRYVTTVWGDDGGRSVIVEKEGPTGLITTTTRAFLDRELETRILTLHVDDSRAQTGRIIVSKGRAARLGRNSGPDLNPWLALQQRLNLEGGRVVFPQGEIIGWKCATGAIRLRRDFPLVLSLVKSHALLNFWNRERDKEGRIIATLEDYRTVYDLVSDLIAEGSGAKVPEPIRETVEAVRDLGGMEINKKEISDKLRIDKSTAWRRVYKALLLGFLVNEEERKGHPAKLRLGESMPNDRAVLPHPDHLYKKLSWNPDTFADTPSPETGEIVQP
jgi:hypothetical protein